MSLLKQWVEFEDDSKEMVQLESHSEQLGFHKEDIPEVLYTKHQEEDLLEDHAKHQSAEVEH